MILAPLPVMADGGVQLFDNAGLKKAADMWTSNPAGALAKYGPVRDWNTSQVTDMTNLFYRCYTWLALNRPQGWRAPVASQ